MLAYSLVQQLNKSANELLWLAIVGLTDQIVHERVENESYIQEAQSLQSEVAALNQGSSDELVKEVEDEAGGGAVQVREHVSSAMRLENVQELRLFLLRHWSVYAAAKHSPYVYSRLLLHKTENEQASARGSGRDPPPLHPVSPPRPSLIPSHPRPHPPLTPQALKSWFAVMGLPLPECTQQFSYMKKTLREGLFDSMLTHGTARLF